MVQLKLQITRPSFEAILRGEQKIESREVKPRNASRYVVEKELPDGSIEVTPKHIDALYLINGRRKDAPRLTVEVLGAEWWVHSDDDGNDITFEENGETFLWSEVWYHLGRILATENCERYNV